MSGRSRKKRRKCSCLLLPTSQTLINVSATRYLQAMKMLRSDWFRTFLIMVGGTIVNTYGLGWVHFEKLPLSTFWWVIIARSCSSILSLIAIRIFCPNVFSRFGLGNKPNQLLISLGVVLLLIGPSLLQIDYRGVGSAKIFESFVFALFIGIDEDLFSSHFDSPVARLCWTCSKVIYDGRQL